MVKIIGKSLEEITNDEREDKSNNFGLLVPPNPAKEYKDRIAEHIVNRIHNAMMSSAGSRVQIVVPTGWKAAL